MSAELPQRPEREALNFIQPEAPQTAAPQELAPEVLFKAHVDDIRQGGDAFDARRNAHLPYWIRYWATAAMGSVVVTNGQVAPTLACAGLLFGGSGAILKIRDRRIRRQDDVVADQKAGHESQKANDARYDLYRTRPRDGRHGVTMHWLGPDRNEKEATAIEELGRIAKLADQAGIDSVLIRPQLLKDMTGSTTGPSTPFRTWAGKNKGVLIKGPAEDDQLLEAPPKVWLVYAETAEPPAEEKTVFVREEPGLDGILHAAWVRKTVGLADHELRGGLAEVPKPSQATEGAITKIRFTVPQLIPLQPQSGGSYVHELALNRASDKTPLQHNRVESSKVYSIYGLTIGTALAGAIIVGQMGADNSLAARKEEAAAEIAAEHGHKPQDVIVDPAAIDDRVNSWSSMNRIWGAWHGVRTHPFDAVDAWAEKFRHHEEGMPQPAGTIVDGTIGNVGKPSTATAWTLAPRGLSPDDLVGHWTISTSDEADGFIDDANMPRLSWSTTTMYDKNYNLSHVTQVGLRLPESAMDEQGELLPYIAVTGTVSRFDKIFPSVIYDGLYLAVPVLNGYQIAAANLNGKPVDVLHKPDGTYALKLPSETEKETGPLQYWLIKGGSPGPHAIAPRSLLAESNAPNAMAFDQAALDRVLHDNIPNLDSMAPADLTAYIQTTSKYSYNPWPEKELAGKKAVENLVELTLKEKQSNCNTAVEVLEAVYPELNPTFEFKNDSDPLVLTGDEAHARAVDPQGKAYDPAPPAALEPVNGPEKPAPLPLERLGGIAAMVAMGGILFKRRKRLANRVIQGLAARAAQGIAWSEGKTLRETVAMTDHIMWSPTPATIDNSIIEKAGTDTSMKPTDAYAMLKQPERHNKEMIKQLEQIPGFTTAHRQALRVARLASRNVKP